MRSLEIAFTACKKASRFRQVPESVCRQCWHKRWGLHQNSSHSVLGKNNADHGQSRIQEDSSGCSQGEKPQLCHRTPSKGFGHEFGNHCKRIAVNSQSSGCFHIPSRFDILETVPYRGLWRTKSVTHTRRCKDYFTIGPDLNNVLLGGAQKRLFETSWAAD